MNLKSTTDDIRNLLAESSFILPFSFAIWRLGEDEVFLSNKLSLMISAGSNFLDAYNFVKMMHRTFGSFLNTAVDKIGDGDRRKDFSSSVNILGEEFSLKLTFFKEKELYLFVADNSKKSDPKSVTLELEKILDSLPICVWQKNKDLKITYCNDAYAKALETNKEYVLLNNIKLIPPSRRRSIYVDQNLYSSKPKKALEHIVINGSRRLLSITESPFSEDGKSTGVAIDITDKEEVEKNYKNYRKQAEEVWDNISVPVAIFDADAVLVFANSAIIKLFSIESLDIYNNCKLSDIMDYLISNESILSSQDITKYKEMVMDLFQTVIEPHCTSVQLKNGNTMAVTISPNHGGGLIFMFEDISDKIALEREVNAMTAVQTDTLNHLSEGVVVFGADNRIKMVNSAANSMWEKEGNSEGIHINDFFEASIALFNSESEDKLLSSRLINMAAQRIEFSETLSLFNGKTYNYSYIPLPDGLNLVKFSDITDSSNLEKLLQEKTDIVDQIDKLKSNLISNISYELRAPLQTIKGFAEILFNKYFGDLNDKQLEYCYGIANSVERLTEIVDAVISLANIEAGQIKIKYSEVKLLKLIQESIKLFSERAKASGIKLSTDFKDSKFSVFIDEQSFKQALFHLISRSLRITPSGGSLTISISTSASDPDYFNLIIKDSGALLSEEELERIRKTLIDNSSKKELDRSVEFGLILANNIVKLHNGEITIESNEESGNSITCHIPVKQFLQ